MMRLHAVRVAGVRRFADPVAVEGFGAGLNLLSGPNELGKSTLLQALRAAMFETYSGNSQSHRDLASTEGGDPAPLIEVEFEAGGRMWRLRKQFLGAPKATLLDMGSGAVLRNAEAQAQLAALLHGPSDLRPFGLLWVSQAEVLDKKQTIEPEKEFKGLPGFIATAVDAIALDADASAVHEKIKLVLGKLVQDKNRNNPKAGGDWAKARSASEAANAYVEVAQRRLETQAARLAELASKTAARDQLSAPAEVAARGHRARLAGERHARALKAQAARTTSAEKLRTALEAADSAGREHETVRAAVDEMSNYQAKDSLTTEGRRTVQRAQAAAAADLEAARITATRAAGAVVTLEGQVKAAQLALRAAEAARQRDELHTRINAARDAENRHAMALQDVANFAAITPARVSSLRTTVDALAKLDAALAAVVPEVKIELAPGGAGRIHIDGHPVPESGTWNPKVPLVLDITGVGRISIAPNPATVSATQRTQYETKRAEAVRLYAALGAATLADAEARLDARGQALTAADTAMTLVNFYAPQGVDALVAQYTSLTGLSADADPNMTPAAVAALEVQRDAARTTRDDAAKSLAVIDSACSQLREQIIALDATDKADKTRRTELLRQFGTSAEAGELLRIAALKHADAQVAHRAADIAARSWASDPDADKVAVHEAVRTAADAALDDAERQLAEIGKSMENVLGQLQATGDDDLETELERSQANVASAAAALADIESEVAALTMLDQQLTALGDTARRQISAPILAHIQPYLTHVFPGATLELGAALAPAKLLRNGRQEPHAQLSRGTQEQIAILVRLGLARLLAGNKAAVPLVLDDALVFADDQRMDQIFAALQDAALQHQVIVLNCRERAFSSLASSRGTTVLRITPWAMA